MDFYLTLQEIMKQKGLTIPEVARSCGLTDSTVRSIIDRKQKKIALNIAFKLSHGLGVSLERLNGEQVDTTPIQDFGILLNNAEKEFIKKYRTLDEYGKAAVDSILNIEHKRCAEQVDLPHPMVMAAARSGAVSQIEEIHPNELPDNTPLP